MKKALLFSLIWMIWHSAFAVQDAYTFASQERELQFTRLTNQLRCLVCQNQNIAESNAPLAADLRQQIYEKVSSNESSEAIIDYLVKRYGDYILYSPPLNWLTLLLWFGPFLLLGLGLGFLFFYLHQKREI